MTSCALQFNFRPTTSVQLISPPSPLPFFAAFGGGGGAMDVESPHTTSTPKKFMNQEASFGSSQCSPIMAMPKKKKKPQEFALAGKHLPFFMKYTHSCILGFIRVFLYKKNKRVVKYLFIYENWDY
jgi:hypothetical protein